MQKIKFLWLREDFRLNDNPAYQAISNSDEKFQIFYSFDEKKFKERSAQRWWLYQTLQKLEKQLSEKGILFTIYASDEIATIKNIARSQTVGSIYCNELYEPNEIKKDLAIEAFLKVENIEFRKFKGNLLQSPFSIKKKDGTPFQVFTPYWRNAEEQYLKGANYSKKISKFKAKPVNNNNKEILEQCIKPKKIGIKNLKNTGALVKNLRNYYLRNLLITKFLSTQPIEIFPLLQEHQGCHPTLLLEKYPLNTFLMNVTKFQKKNIGFRKYINEIGWREFAHHLINHFPDMETGNLRKQFDKFKWVKDNNKLKKWKMGMTGYPIVDAGMRELYETGWMHNRVRMITASFLVKHLRIHWMEGEKHFRDSLLDFNTANNIAGWQWVAGCGADAAPYFRIFNPILQGEKFDPEGIYVKQWVKELSNVPKKFIHKPWELPGEESEKINFNLEKDYTKPIVKHEEARKLALQAFADLKK